MMILWKNIIANGNQNENRVKQTPKCIEYHHFWVTICSVRLVNRNETVFFLIRFFIYLGINFILALTFRWKSCTPKTKKIKLNDLEMHFKKKAHSTFGFLMFLIIPHLFLCYFIEMKAFLFNKENIKIIHQEKLLATTEENKIQMNQKIKMKETIIEPTTNFTYLLYD